MLKSEHFPCEPNATQCQATSDDAQACRKTKKKMLCFRAGDEEISGMRTISISGWYY